MIIIVLQVLLALLVIIFVRAWMRADGSSRHGSPVGRAEAFGLGAVTNFLDALGVGSFAVTTVYAKVRRLIPDECIPATMIVGHALPTMAQAFIFINLVNVGPLLLLACICAAVLGAWLGAPIVARMSVRKIRIGMGCALAVAAVVFALSNLGWMPGGGDAVDLSGGWFVLAVIAHFILGALMTLGIGLYAPSLILLSLIGLNPRVAFPIMMGACAFLMPIASLRFLKTDRVVRDLAIGLMLGGVPGVLIAVYVVTSLPLQTLRWGVVVVVLYAAIVMLRDALRSPAEPAMRAAPGRPEIGR